MARVDHGIRRACSGALLCMMLLLASSPHGDNTPVDALTVLSWGGAYERAQQRALFAPFTEVTGIPVEVHQYDGDIAELRRAVAEGKVPWDLIDMTRSQAKSACAEQLLEPLSPDLPAPAPDGTPAERDFIDGA